MKPISLKIIIIFSIFLSGCTLGLNFDTPVYFDEETYHEVDYQKEETLSDTEEQDTFVDNPETQDLPVDNLVDEPEDTTPDQSDTKEDSNNPDTRDISETAGRDMIEAEDECILNPCGGCSPLNHELGSPCGECGSYQCSGTELFCQDTGRNPCGGCEYPGHEPGDLCNFGYYKCEGNTMICEDRRYLTHATSCAHENDCDSPIWGQANAIDSDLSTAWSSIERDEGIPTDVEALAFWFSKCEVDHVRIWPYVFEGRPQHFPELIEVHKSTDNGWVLMEIYYDINPNHLPYHRLEFAAVRTGGLLIRGITMTDDGAGNYYFQLAEVSVACLDYE